MVACEYEEELPLLLYDDELDTTTRSELEAHARTCGECSRALSELRSAAKTLDADTIPMPSGERFADLKEAILARVALPADPVCVAVQEDLVAGLPSLEPARRGEVEGHLSGCGGCRGAKAGFAATAAALDAIPLVRPSDEKWRALKPRVLELTGARVTSIAAVRARRVLARAAAAVLVFALGVGASHVLPRTSLDQLRALKLEADQALGETGDLMLAMARYQHVVGQGAGRPEAAREVDGACRELVAIHQFQVALRAPRDEQIVKLEELLVEHPESKLARYAIRKLEILRQGAPLTPGGIVARDPRVKPDLNADTKVNPTSPEALAQLRRAAVMATEELQAGRRAEAAGLVQDAIDHYREARKAAPGSIAALHAQDALTRLGVKD